MKSKTMNLAVAAGLALSVALTPASAYAAYAGFPDIAADHWAVKSGVIDWCVETGAFTGFPDGTFAPDAKIDRAQAAGVIYKYEGEPARNGATGGFTDFDQLSWAEDAAMWCATQGIFTGNAATGAFEPWSPLTREQAAKVLCVYAGGTEGSGDLSGLGFRDPESVSGWARGVVAWAAENGIMNGVERDDGRYFEGQRACTRAEFAAMLQKAAALRDVGNLPGEPGDEPVTPTDPKPGDVDPVTGKVWGTSWPAWDEKTE